MKLRSMKLTEKEREKVPEAVVADRPRYPWGLGLHLDDEVLGKLELGSLPEVGKTMMVQARVKVTGAMEQENEGGKSRSVSLQIEDMGIGPDAGEGDSAADKLYDGKG